MDTFYKGLTPQTMSNKHESFKGAGDSIFLAPEKLPSPFFKLPAELRNVIYEDVLLDFNLGNAFACFGGVTYVQYRPLHLLFVNRQIYQEVRLLPYSISSVTAGPRTQFPEWKARRTQDQLRAIKRLHFVFDSFFYRIPPEEAKEVTDYGFSVANNLAVDALVKQQLYFPELKGLQQVFLELRSATASALELVEQIRILDEAKLRVKDLNPQVEVTLELQCLGTNLHQFDIPSSSEAGFHIVRHDQICEGEHRSIHEILRRKGLTVSTYARSLMLMRETWDWVVEEQRRRYS